jgi:two-component sensor histidine kinase
LPEYRHTPKSERAIELCLGELCAEQIVTSGLPITHSITCDDVVLDLDQLVPIALIVSELITSCLKHGFKDRSAGHISISLWRCTSNHEVELTVDGCGVTDASNCKGLRRTIICGLAAQLNGKSTCASDEETTETVRFRCVSKLLHPQTASKVSQSQM